jgi:hypothetical protein
MEEPVAEGQEEPADGGLKRRPALDAALANELIENIASTVFISNPDGTIKWLSSGMSPLVLSP